MMDCPLLKALSLLLKLYRRAVWMILVHHSIYFDGCKNGADHFVLVHKDTAKIDLLKISLLKNEA
jgi:hypothetical protein